MLNISPLPYFSKNNFLFLALLVYANPEEFEFGGFDNERNYFKLKTEHSQKCNKLSWIANLDPQKQNHDISI